MPTGVVTLILPELAPTGTVACNSLAEIFVTLVAAVPLKRTLLALSKLPPLICTVPPTCALAGAKPETRGGAIGRIGGEAVSLESIDSGVPLAALSVAGIT